MHKQLKHLVLGILSTVKSSPSMSQVSRLPASRRGPRSPRCDNANDATRPPRYRLPLGVDDDRSAMIGTSRNSSLLISDTRLGHRYMYAYPVGSIVRASNLVYSTRRGREEVRGQPFPRRNVGSAVLDQQSHRSQRPFLEVSSRTYSCTL